MNRDTHASGAFTSVTFVLHEGAIKILVPRRHAVGQRGDLVYTIWSQFPGGPRACDIFRSL